MSRSARESPDDSVFRDEAVSASRLKALRDLDILDTEPEEAFDRLTRIAADFFGVEVAFVAFLDSDRQWFKSEVGLGRSESSLAGAFCTHTIEHGDVLVVEDALEDERVSGSPFVTEAGLRFYAGVPIRAAGEAIGTFSIMDPRPQSLSDEEASRLEDFGQMASEELRRRQTAREHEEMARQFEAIMDAPDVLVGVLSPDGTLLEANETALQYIEESKEEVLGQPFWEMSWWTGEARADVRSWVEKAASGEYVEMEANLRGQRGEIHSVEGSIRPAGGDGGEAPEALVVSVRDVTERKRREEELRRLSEAVRQANEAVLITEAEPLEEPGPRIVYVNEAFEEQSGYSREEILGKTPRILQGPETDPDVLDSLREALEAGEEWAGETTNYRKNGEPYRVQWSLAPVRGNGGEIEHWVSVQRDVTEERRREEELRRQKGLLEQAQRLAGAWEVDLRTGEVSATEKVYEIHEVEPQTEIKAEEIPEFYPPESGSDVLEALERCAEEGEPYDREVPFVTAKGNRRWVRTVGGPSETDGGTVTKIAGAFQDITERKRREEELRRSERRWKTLLEHLRSGVHVTLDGTIQYVNPAGAEILGADDPDEIVGRDGQDFIPEDAEIDVEGRLERLRQGEPTEPAEYEIVRQDGTRRLVSVYSMPVELGEKHGRQTVFRDVTEERWAQRELQDREERIRGLANSIPGVVYQFYARPDGTYGCYFVSDRAEDILGIDPEPETFYERFLGRVPVSEREDLVRSVDQAVEEGRPWSREIPFERPDGTRIWLSGASAPSHREAEGEEELVYNGVLLDITERKRAEATARLQTQVLRKVTEGAPLETVLGILLTGLEELRPDMLGSVLLHNQETGRMRHGAAPSLPAEYNRAIDGMEPGPKAGSCGTAIHSGSPVITEDITEDPRWEGYRELAAAHDLRACWSLPIDGSEGEILGSFAMYFREPARPSERDRELLRHACSLARIAIERHRAEQTLREERDRFATLFRSLPTPVLRGTLQGEGVAGEGSEVIVRDVNPAFEETFGYARNQAQGKRLRTLIVPPDQQAEATALNRRVLGEDKLQKEVERVAATGVRDFRLQATARARGDGPPEVYAIYTDVTEKRERERRRRRHREALLELTTDEAVAAGDLSAATRRITETAAETLQVHRVNIWLLDEQDEVLRCVDAFETGEGHSSGFELALEEHSSYVEVLRENRVLNVPDARSDERTADLEEDYLAPHGIGALLNATVRSEGEVRGVICHEHVGRKRQWTDDEIQFAGEIAEVVHRAFRNQRQAEQREQLAFQRSLLQAQQEAVLDGILVVGKNREVLSYNDRFAEMWEVPEALLEEGRDEGLLQWVGDKIENSRSFFESVERLYEHPQETSREEIRLSDGRTFDRFSAPVVGENQVHYGRIWTFRDITDRKRHEQALLEAKEEAEEAARLKTALLANMSHEIRTPLTSIIGFAELLKDHVSGEATEFAERVRQGGKRLMKTLDSVLELSRLEAGAADLTREEVSLRDVVRETVNVLRPSAETKSISLEVDLPECSVDGHWNEGALCRILENLLENAIKFTPEGGRVEVRAQAEGEEAVLEVEDSGVGISEEVQEGIFRAFKQESEGRDREYEGAGLGLSIVKRLAELHGGTVEVNSDKGKGSCFVVRLPKAPPEEASKSDSTGS